MGATPRVARGLRAHRAASFTWRIDQRRNQRLRAPTRRARAQALRWRLAITLLGLTVLALVSTVFGMMMAVAQDLPELESQNEFREARNSVLYARPGGKRRLAVMTGAENRILVDSGDISSNVKRAVVAIEDQRFYSHKGVDYRGIARALWEDVRRQRAARARRRSRSSS